MQTDLTISLINHSNPQMLRDCLRSLFAATHAVTLDVWVVDNATGGALVPELQAEFPQVQWLFNTERRGFSANHNQVLHRVVADKRSRHACILNDDTLIHDGAFDRLVTFLDAHPAAGMTGAKLLNADGTLQDCVYRFPKLRDEPIHFFILPKAVSHWKSKIIDPVQVQDQPAFVDWILGACMVVRREVLEQVGLLDDVLSPVACMEEVDWCYRTHAAGWKIGYCPAAVITHIRGQSIKPAAGQVGPDRIQLEMYKALYRYYKKHRGTSPASLLLLLHAAALPWNALMLTQGVLRRHITPAQYKRQLGTGWQVARLIGSLPREAAGGKAVNEAQS